MEILGEFNMKVLKEENFEVYSFLDNVRGNDVGEIIDKCVEEVPEIQNKGYAGYKTKKDLTQTLDIFLLDKNRNHNLFISKNTTHLDIFKIVKETMRLLEPYQRKKKYVFVFPCFDNFTVENMNGVGGFCPKKEIIFLFLNLNGKDWEKSLKDSLIHEFVHSVSEYYLGGEDFNLGEGLIFDGLSENFRKMNFGGNDLLIDAVSKEDAMNYFEEFKDKLESNDFDFYMEIFYGTGKYPSWLGYSLGYYLVKEYLEHLNDLDWNILLRKNPKEILKKILNFKKIKNI